MVGDLVDDLKIDAEAIANMSKVMSELGESFSKAMRKIVWGMILFAEDQPKSWVIVR